MSRLDIEKQNNLEPKRLEYAKKQIEALGFRIEFECRKMLQFKLNGHTITFYPYSGWATGSGIKDGRGLENLLKQLRDE